MSSASSNDCSSPAGSPRNRQTGRQVGIPSRADLTSAPLPHKPHAPSKTRRDGGRRGARGGTRCWQRWQVRCRQREHTLSSGSIACTPPGTRRFSLEYKDHTDCDSDMSGMQDTGKQEHHPCAGPHEQQRTLEWQHACMHACTNLDRAGAAGEPPTAPHFYAQWYMNGAAKA